MSLAKFVVYFSFDEEEAAIIYSRFFCYINGVVKKFDPGLFLFLKKLVGGGRGEGEASRNLGTVLSHIFLAES